MAIELHIVQFWSEILLVISTRAAGSFNFEIMRTISDQIALHSTPRVQNYSMTVSGLQLI